MGGHFEHLLRCNSSSEFDGSLDEEFTDLSMFPSSFVLVVKRLFHVIKLSSGRFSMKFDIQCNLHDFKVGLQKIFKLINYAALFFCKA